MTAEVFTLPSRNAHATCHLFPCKPCREKKAAEQAARDRHPAGKDLPTSLEFEQGWDENGTYAIVHVDDQGTTLELDESMLRQLLACATADPPLCRNCPNWASKGAMDGLCPSCRDNADAVPINGWRR